MDFNQINNQNLKERGLVNNEIKVALPYTDLFYPQYVDNDCKHVYITELTAKDEYFFTNPTFEAEELVYAVMKSKVRWGNHLPIDELLVGHAEIIYLHLRVMMSHEYKVELIDPTTGAYFPYTLDMRTLKHQQLKNRPMDGGLFEYRKGDTIITFRLPNLKIDQFVNLQYKREKQHNPKISTSDLKRMKVVACIQSWGGDDSKTNISLNVERMPLLEYRKFINFINECNFSIDTNVEVESPSGARFQCPIPITREFIIPSE